MREEMSLNTKVNFGIIIIIFIILTPQSASQFKSIYSNVVLINELFRIIDCIVSFFIFLFFLKGGSVRSKDRFTRRGAQLHTVCGNGASVHPSVPRAVYSCALLRSLARLSSRKTRATLRELRESA